MHAILLYEAEVAVLGSANIFLRI